jgi:hypothetical protein
LKFLKQLNAGENVEIQAKVPNCSLIRPHERC